MVHVRVWVPVYVRTGSIVDYWAGAGAAPPFGAAGLTIECIVVLCLCVSQYIMRVHLEINIFGVGEMLILALRHSTTR